MAGPTIGRAEIQVDLDGDNIPRQTRALGEAAGLAAGGAFNEQFMASLKKLSDRLRPVTDKIGTSLRGFFRKLGPSMAQAGADAGDQMGKGLEKSFKRSWTNIGRSMGDGLTRFLTPATRDASREIDQLGSTAERTFGGNGGRGLDRMSKALVRLGDNSREASDDLGGLFKVTRSLGPASRNSGREIDRMGQSMERSFSDGGGGRGLVRMRRDVDRLGESSRESSIDIGEMFQVFENGTDASEQMTDSTDRQNDATNRNGGSWSRLNNVMSDMFSRMRGWTDGFDRHTKATNDSARAAGNHSNRSMELNLNFDKLTDSLSRNSDATGRNEGSQRSLWKRLSGNTRQWILIGAAIAAAGTEIAILGSAAGSSLAVLGTVATTIGVAVAVGIAGFKGMTGPLEDIEPAARPAAIALKDMGAAMGELQNGIQASLFADLAGPFNELTDALPKLQDGLNGVAGAVGIVIGSFAKGLASPRGIEVMSRLLQGMQGIIVGLGDVVGNLGSALGTIFVAALPSTNLFVTALEDMTDRFRLFLQSAEGQTALAGFFQTLETVMPPIVDLLGATGRALASLVTPDSIARFVAFTDNLTEFMPMLATFLTIVGELNIFGVLAELLVAFGQALAPLVPGLMMLADTISTTLIGLLQAAVGPIAAVMQAFAPLLDVFTQMVVGIGDFVTRALGPLSEGFIGLGGVVTGFAASAGPILGDIFSKIGDVLITLLPIFFELITALLTVASAFIEAVLPGILPVISVLGTLGQMLQPLGDMILSLVPSAEKFGTAIADFMFMAMSSFVNMLPSIMAFFSSLGPIITAFGDFFVSLGPIISAFIEVLAANLGPILQSIGGLLTALAPVFFGLVTAVLQVGYAFLGALLPAIAPLIDIFTSMVPVLKPIVTAIAGLAPVAATLGGVLGDYLVTGFQAVADLLPSLVASFGPLLTAVLDIIAVVAPMLVPILSKLWDVFILLIPVVLQLVTAVVNALLPAFQPLMDVVLALIPMFLPLIDVIVALTPTVAMLAGMIVDILILALDALLPLFPALIQIIQDLAPLIPPLAEFLGTVLVVAIELVAALLPPLIGIFMSLWETVKPLIPLIVLLLDAAMFPLTMAIEFLIPIIGFLFDVLDALLDPIMKMITPMEDSTAAFDFLSDAIADGMDMIREWGDIVGDVLDGAIGWIRDTIGWFEDLFGASSQDFSGGSSRRGGGTNTNPNNTVTYRPTATGGLFNSPSYRLIGEAGPEAVVPLNRDLSQVDPAVRALSAFAQGMGGAGSAASAGRQVNVAPGAIVVQTVANPELTASAVLDRLVASAR